jgi:putative acetyltransferase
MGIGSALMDELLTAADVAHVPLIVLLGSPQYYSRFDSVPQSSWA